MLNASNTWNKLEGFFFEKVSPYPLSFIRIGLGLTMLIAYLCRYSEIELIHGPEGILRYTFSPGAPNLLMENIWLVYVTMILACCCFTLGIATRLSGIFVGICHLLFTFYTSRYEWGWAGIIHGMVLYTALGNSSSVLSLSGQNTKAESDLRISIWPLRLLQVHTCAVYIAASWHRFDDFSWLRGEMIYEALTYTMFGRFPLLDLSAYQETLVYLTWITLFMEMTAPVFLWFRQTRKFYVVYLLSMHLVLELTTRVGWWNFMLGVSLLSFFPGQERKDNNLLTSEAS